MRDVNSPPASYSGGELKQHAFGCLKEGMLILLHRLATRSAGCHSIQEGGSCSRWRRQPGLGVHCRRSERFRSHAPEDGTSEPWKGGAFKVHARWHQNILPAQEQTPVYRSPADDTLCLELKVLGGVEHHDRPSISRRLGSLTTVQQLGVECG
jgi:hypothetical protein